MVRPRVPLGPGRDLQQYAVLRAVVVFRNVLVLIGWFLFIGGV